MTCLVAIYSQLLGFGFEKKLLLNLRPVEKKISKVLAKLEQSDVLRLDFFSWLGSRPIDIDTKIRRKERVLRYKTNTYMGFQSSLDEVRRGSFA